MAHGTKPSFQHYATTLSGNINANVYNSPDKMFHSSETLQVLQQQQEDADNSVDILISELQPHVSADTTLASLSEATNAIFGLNRAELSESVKSYIAEAASVRQSSLGEDPEQNISFAEDVLKTAGNGRAESSLVAETRRLKKRTLRLKEETKSLKRVIETRVELKPADKTDVKMWQAGATRFEVQAQTLRKKLDDLKVPSEFAIQKRRDECDALITEVNAIQQRLKRFEGLPASLAEAGRTVQEVRRELDELRHLLRDSNAHLYGFAC